MTPSEYQKETLRIESGMSHKYPTLFNGLMGLNGEAGEAIDILRENLFQNRDLDKNHLIKELGDVAWYLSVSAYALNVDLETLFQISIDSRKKGDIYK